MTGHVSIVGAGPGDPQLLTRKAVARLRAADLVLYDALVDPRVLAFAKRAQRFFVGKRSARGPREQSESAPAAGIDDRRSAKPSGSLEPRGPGVGPRPREGGGAPRAVNNARHAISQPGIHALMIRAARKGKRVVRLKGGDPFVFGRGGEEALALRAAGISFDIVPGVSSAVAAPALAGIPVTHRGLASAFLVVGGHDEAAFASAIGGLRPNGVTIVVLMGVGRSAALAALLIDRGWARGTPAALIVDASTPRQHAWYGRLDALAADEVSVDGHGPGTLVIGDVVTIAARIGASDNEDAAQIGVSDDEEAPAAVPAAASAKRAAGAGHQRVGVGPHDRVENEVSYVSRR
jgi:uroporphyrin-III C-methyltransferase/precorrin-2 dehydrogenase/sirohydrochlorin ferrochelatase